MKLSVIPHCILKMIGWSVWQYGPRRPFEPKEIDGLLVPPGKSSVLLLVDHLKTGKPLRSEPAQEKWLKSNHPYI